MRSEGLLLMVCRLDPVAQRSATLTPTMDRGFFSDSFSSLASRPGKYITVTVIEKIIPFSHKMYYPRPTFLSHSYDQNQHIDIRSGVTFLKDQLEYIL
jgi:hypothetical protein